MSVRTGLAWICLAGFASAAQPLAQDSPLPARHFVFINFEMIWTLEMVDDVPVVNIITFTQGEWPLRPQQIRIYNQEGQRARVMRFSMETGERPYITSYFKVLGSSFIGIDLIGDFSAFQEPARVEIDLGKFRYQLQSLDPLGFENLVQQINKINFDSPDITQDFEVLKIEHLGQRRMIPRK